ncbi:MAG: hypothetical protein HY544_00585 [Candidatus Diapherotrites archaeon]|uniref:beta-fructofuranosidase n=1 Tax=Candidatus Iainarchaeum sp. TaxID=3101447 RepID=A0A8T3YP72_9ARCH|nr:hypothetical protein [Candidatus Diapherotrites archaeon]
MQDIVETAAAEAVKALRSCVTPNGLYASGGRGGYSSVWARDSMISLIGASFHTPEFRGVFAKSLSVLAKYQSANGQIPNCVDVFERINDKPVTFATIDSSLWFVLGEHFYRKRFGASMRGRHAGKVKKAMTWIGCQDAGEDSMPEQLPTSDWQDCFPHKYGHTINTQALYYAALRVAGRKAAIPFFVKQVNSYLWDEKLGYFLPWHWKDHGEYSEKAQWFDSLGNILAAVLGLATKRQAKRILAFIEDKGINRPFPVRVIYPPISRGSAEWRDYFDACLAAERHSYLNGGIWPFVGGFYVTALVAAGELRKAREELALLAKANSLGRKFPWDFNEWISPVEKKAMGSRHQAWSAGTYLLAYHAVKTGRNPLKV